RATFGYSRRLCCRRNSTRKTRSPATLVVLGKKTWTPLSTRFQNSKKICCAFTKTRTRVCCWTMAGSLRRPGLA
ncbi:hypothetical protein LPJ77_007165, partial [Coemansia sp. RSA 2523]